jgi:Tfp pilus assembly protein PilP
MRSVKTLALGILLGAAGPGLHAQAKPATTTTKTAPQPQAKPAAQVTAKTSAPAAATQAKPPAVAATKPAAQPQAKPVPAAPKPATQAEKAPPSANPKAKNSAPKKAARPAASTAKTAEADKEPKIARRDPFASMVGREQAGTRTDLPPGKAGLQVGTLRLDGIVRAPSGMIAVVSNPQSRTYFLREGDQLYDGRVEKIAMDGVSFHEVGKDAFGKPVERQVNKRIYASAGEQQ